MVDVSIEIIEAEGGTRCAGITAAAVALADAGIPMKDIVVVCAAGKVNDQIVVDLSEKEDKEGQADVPIAIMPRTGEITLLQADGNLTEEEFEEALDLAMEGCMKISELQHEALKKRYSSEYVVKIWILYQKLLEKVLQDL
jgi:exosome complex component RRP41